MQLAEYKRKRGARKRTSLCPTATTRLENHTHSAIPSSSKKVCTSTSNVQRQNTTTLCVNIDAQIGPYGMCMYVATNPRTQASLISLVFESHHVNTSADVTSTPADVTTYPSAETQPGRGGGSGLLELPYNHIIESCLT